MSGDGEPLQVVRTGDEDNDYAFELVEENLESILGKVPQGMKVAVVSVVGAFRTGKSFLLTFLLRYLKHGDALDAESTGWMHADGQFVREGNSNVGSAAAEEPTLRGFAWRGGQERQTTGIWMWSEPFIRRVPSHPEDVAVLIMDTQGMFDNETTMSLTACIFGLSTLVSSYQIYNVDKRIQEDHLQHLALFSEYGRIGLVSDDAEGKDAGGDSKDERAAAQPAAEKPFQRLDFLVRDWQNFEDDAAPYAELHREMNTYLQEVIRPRGHSDLAYTREQIGRCFGKISCFLLPHPGPHVTKKNFDGDIEKIEPAFRSLLNRLARRVFDDLIEPKRLNGRFITAPEMLQFVKAYVSMFREGAQFPQAVTMLEATATANNESAKQLASLAYQQALDAVAGPASGFMRPEDLEKEHERALDAAFAKFDEVANMGPPGLIAEKREKLKGHLAAAWERYRETNSNRNPFKNAEVYVVAVAVGVISFLLSSILDAMCSEGTTCDQTADKLKFVYLTLIAVGVYVYWRYLQQLFNYMKEIAPAMFASAGIKLKES